MIRQKVSEQFVQAQNVGPFAVYVSPLLTRPMAIVIGDAVLVSDHGSLEASREAARAFLVSRSLLSL